MTTIRTIDIDWRELAALLVKQSRAGSRQRAAVTVLGATQTWVHHAELVTVTEQPFGDPAVTVNWDLAPYALQQSGESPHDLYLLALAYHLATSHTTSEFTLGDIDRLFPTTAQIVIAALAELAGVNSLCQ
ncbi:hypothetical protein [Glycomyces sp. YM15]|uniref:hypothetical protein n=1 Tax=Glycomyces sp. YM15 TaxID=2800446 RepID=UPI001964244B|nr:hypothetical protein [Glycomyces sp. YM15]